MVSRLRSTRTDLGLGASSMQEILFLAHRVPWPPDRGDKIRSFHILNKLKTLAPVHVGAFADDTRDMGFAEAERAGFASLHAELRDKPQWLAGIEGQACIADQFRFAEDAGLGG
jgi:polysaccharide biosynthesis protein PslH